MILLDAAVRSLLLGLSVWLLLSILRPHNPHVRKTVWIVVLASSLAMPLLIRAVPTLPIHAPAYGLTLGIPSAGGTRAVPATAWHGITALYMLIAAALACRFGYGLMTLWRVRRGASVLTRRESGPLCACWSRGLDVRSSPGLSGPATFGSTILLPARCADWSEHKLAAVLAHECSHVRERDCYVLWAARIHCCIFWFNPLAWWLLRQLAALAEITSDDAAIELIRDRLRYAEILLELARERPLSQAAAAMARPNVSVRIERVLSGVAPSCRPRLRQRALATAILLPAVAVAAAPTTSTHMLASRMQAAATTGSTHDADAPRDTGTPRAPDLPRVVGWPSPAALETYYPAAARRKGIDGFVRIAVTLDREGHAIDTRILTERPLDSGFGAAASSLAHLMRYSNPTDRQTRIVFNIKFALGAGGARSPHPAAPAARAPGRSHT